LFINGDPLPRNPHVHRLLIQLVDEHRDLPKRISLLLLLWIITIICHYKKFPEMSSSEYPSNPLPSKGHLFLPWLWKQRHSQIEEMFEPAQTRINSGFWRKAVCIENANEPVNFCFVKRDPIVELSSARTGTIESGTTVCRVCHRLDKPRHDLEVKKILWTSVFHFRNVLPSRRRSAAMFVSMGHLVLPPLLLLHLKLPGCWILSTSIVAKLWRSPLTTFSLFVGP